MSKNGKEAIRDLSSEAEILEKLRKSILEFEPEDAEVWANKAMEEKVDPAKAVDVLIEAVREVGDAFGREEIFLPELMMAAEAMKRAMPIIEKELKNTGREREAAGTLVIGTVESNIHDIGKTIVATLFEAAGFRVVDLGVDVPSTKFVEAVKEHKPDLLGLSALLTTTAPQQVVVMKLLKEAGIRDRVKVIVGGGAITQAYADEIGADGYGVNAAEAVEVATRLLAAK